MQGFASHATGLSRSEYQVAVSNPAYLNARCAHARNLPDARGKEDYAEYLAVSAHDYSMEEIAEKVRAYAPHAPGSKSRSFSDFLDRKAGRPTSAAQISTIPVKTSADLWADVVAEINGE